MTIIYDEEIGWIDDETGEVVGEKPAAEDARQETYVPRHEHWLLEEFGSTMEQLGDDPHVKNVMNRIYPRHLAASSSIKEYRGVQEFEEVAEVLKSSINLPPGIYADARRVFKAIYNSWKYPTKTMGWRLAIAVFYYLLKKQRYPITDEAFFKIFGTAPGDLNFKKYYNEVVNYIGSPITHEDRADILRQAVLPIIKGVGENWRSVYDRASMIINQLSSTDLKDVEVLFTAVTLALAEEFGIKKPSNLLNRVAKKYEIAV